MSAQARVLEDAWGAAASSASHILPLSKLPKQVVTPVTVARSAVVAAAADVANTEPGKYHALFRVAKESEQGSWPAAVAGALEPETSEHISVQGELVTKALAMLENISISPRTESLITLLQPRENARLSLAPFGNAVSAQSAPVEPECVLIDEGRLFPDAGDRTQKVSGGGANISRQSSNKQGGPSRSADGLEMGGTSPSARDSATSRPNAFRRVPTSPIARRRKKGPPNPKLLTVLGADETAIEKAKKTAAWNRKMKALQKPRTMAIMETPVVKSSCDQHGGEDEVESVDAPCSQAIDDDGEKMRAESLLKQREAGRIYKEAIAESVRMRNPHYRKVAAAKKRQEEKEEKRKAIADRKKAALRGKKGKGLAKKTLAKEGDRIAKVSKRKPTTRAATSRKTRTTKYYVSDDDDDPEEYEVFESEEDSDSEESSVCSDEEEEYDGRELRPGRSSARLKRKASSRNKYPSRSRIGGSPSSTPENVSRKRAKRETGYVSDGSPELRPTTAGVPRRNLIDNLKDGNGNNAMVHSPSEVRHSLPPHANHNEHVFQGYRNSSHDAPERYDRVARPAPMSDHRIAQDAAKWEEGWSASGAHESRGPALDPRSAVQPSPGSHYVDPQQRTPWPSDLQTEYHVQQNFGGSPAPPAVQSRRSRPHGSSGTPNNIPNRTIGLSDVPGAFQTVGHYMNGNSGGSVERTRIPPRSPSSRGNALLVGDYGDYTVENRLDNLGRGQPESMDLTKQEEDVEPAAVDDPILSALVKALQDCNNKCIVAYHCKAWRDLFDFFTGKNHMLDPVTQSQDYLLEKDDVYSSHKGLNCMAKRYIRVCLEAGRPGEVPQRKWREIHSPTGILKRNDDS